MNKRWRKANPETVAQDTESRQTPRTQKVDRRPGHRKQTDGQDTESRQTPRTQKVDRRPGHRKQTAKTKTQHKKKTKNMSNTDLTNNWDEHR